MVCGRIKLLEHTMEVVESFWVQYEMDDVQFGYMPGNTTTNAMFVARQLHEKYSANGKKVYFSFVYLKKVPRQVIPMCNKGH